MKNIFVQTANTRNFITGMKESEKASHDPALLVFYGQAGRGKTSCARFFAAQEGWIYVRALRGWTELWMLQDLCFELSIEPISGMKKRCFEAVKSSLLAHRRPVIVDEADKLTPALLDWVRDLADITFAPFALVGEKLIRHKMEAERRIWSRTLRCVEFQPISAKDILFFAKQAADLTLTADHAEKLRAASDGDFRLVARDVRRLEEIMTVNKLDGVTDEAIANAVADGMRGK